MRKNRSVIDLTHNTLALLPTECAQCCFWETVSNHPPGICKEPGAKARWISQLISSGFVPGKVMFVDNALAGFVLYAPKQSVPRLARLPYPSSERDSVYITCVYVLPDLRGRGYGKSLLLECLKGLTSSGWATVETHGFVERDDRPPGPRGFFESCGFKTVTTHPEAPLLRVELKSLAIWYRRLVSELRGVILVPGGQHSPRGCEKPCI